VIVIVISSSISNHESGLRIKMTTKAKADDDTTDRPPRFRRRKNVSAPLYGATRSGDGPIKIVILIMTA